MRSLSEFWSRPGSGVEPSRTVFVLSGGAAMGALQVGMMRALIERRILPDLILGCSIGAMNGMVLAGGPSLATVGRMQDVWMDLIDRELVPTGLLPSPVQLFRRGESISTNNGLRDLIADVVPAATFEDLAVPFQCVATDIDRGSEVWFDQGDLVTAVLASASIPAVFPPVQIDGARYLDGAIVNDVPVRRALEMGAARIYILQVGAMDQPHAELRRPVDAALLAYWIARRHRLLEDLGLVPEDVEVVILPHGDPKPVRFDDVSSSAHLMDVAYRASSDHLDALADGRIEPTVGPFRDPVLSRPTVGDGAASAAGFDTAHRLMSAARDLIGRRSAAADPDPATTDAAAAPADGPRSDGAPGEEASADESIVEPDGLLGSAAEAVPATGPDGREMPPPDVEVESRGRLMERAEALGPAMRALIGRILERGSEDPAVEPSDPDSTGVAPTGSVAVEDSRIVDPGQSAEK